jgi:hypothetical protein
VSGNGTDGSIENLKQRLALIVQACGDVQSALRTAEDRADGALVSIAHTCEDSAHPEVERAMTELGKVKQGIEDYVAAAANAADAIAAYSMTR